MEPVDPVAPEEPAPALSADARLAFYLEIIKLNKEEVRDLGIVWVYILIGAGAGFLTRVEINPDGRGALGLAGCFIVFAFFYVARIGYCYRSMIGASRGIRSHGLIGMDELGRLELRPRQLWLMGILLAVLPVLALLLVMGLIYIR